MNIIEAKNITKKFKNNGSSTTVFENLNFNLERGLFTSLQGMSGVGKSTLLYCLGTIDKPDSGYLNFYVDDKSINIQKLNDKHLSEVRNKHIGFIFQFHHLLPEFSALENIMMPSLIKGDNYNISKVKAEKLADLVGISHRIKNKPQEMSGGEQQRAAIARALINNPEIVLADEPTGNLDESNAESILKLIEDLKREYALTFLVATHSKEIASIADKRMMMTHGKIETI